MCSTIVVCADARAHLLHVLTRHFSSEDGPPRLVESLGRRVRFWLALAPAPGEIALAIERVSVVFYTFPDFVGVQLVRTWCSGWPTTRRFGEGLAGCRFGCFAVGGDDVRHYLCCPAAADAVRLLPNLQAPVWEQSGDPLLAFGFSLISEFMFCKSALWLYMYIYICMYSPR
jgi:hypothetical protein